MTRSESLAQALAWLAAAALGAAAWLAWPRPAERPPDATPPVVAVVIDASASAVRTRPSWRAFVRERLAEEAERARPGGEHVAVVRAARDVERVFGPAPASELAARLAGRGMAPLDPGLPGGGAGGADAASPIAQALELAGELARAGGAGGRVVLIGDGTHTGRDPAHAEAALARADVRVERVALPPPERSDLALLELAAPPELEAGAPLALALELAFAPGLDAPDPSASVEVVLEREGTSAPARRFPVSLPGDARTGERASWRARIDLGPQPDGRVAVHVRVRLGQRGDPLPENDASSSVVRVGTRRVVGWSAPEAERDALGRLLAGVAGPGLELVPLEPQDIAAELASLDAVVTGGFAGDALPHASLAGFVRRGGGWLALDGPRLAYGPDEPEPALLPLLPEREGRGPRDVLLVVDGSGSMEGEPFERVRRALAALVRGARPEDRLELVFFTGALGARARFTEGLGPASSAGGRAARARALEHIERLALPGGPTALLYSLEELVRERERARRDGLAILLSDGHDALGFDVETRAADVVARLGAARTRLVVFAIGDDADLAYLEHFVAPGEELVRADPGEDWTALFQREMYAEAVDCGAGRAQGVAAARTDGLLAGGVPLGVFGPPLGCIARARAASGAEVVWSTTSGAPLAAVQRVGLGLTASFASAPRPDFSPAWDVEGGFFAPLVRALARGPRGEARIPAARVVGDEIVVTGLAAGAPARLAGRLRRARTDELADDGRALALELVPPDRVLGADAPRAAPLPDVARALGAEPGDALELVLPGSAAGGEGAGGGGIDAGGELVLGLAAPRAVEFRAPRPDAAAAAAPPPGRPPDGTSAERPPHAAAAPLLCLGLAALFAAGAGGAFGRGRGGRSRRPAGRDGRAGAGRAGGQGPGPSGR